VAPCVAGAMRGMLQQWWCVHNRPCALLAAARLTSGGGQEEEAARMRMCDFRDSATSEPCPSPHSAQPPAPRQPPALERSPPTVPRHNPCCAYSYSCFIPPPAAFLAASSLMVASPLSARCPTITCDQCRPRGVDDTLCLVKLWHTHAYRTLTASGAVVCEGASLLTGIHTPAWTSTSRLHEVATHQERA